MTLAYVPRALYRSASFSYSNQLRLIFQQISWSYSYWGVVQIWGAKPNAGLSEYPSANSAIERVPSERCGSAFRPYRESPAVDQISPGAVNHRLLRSVKLSASFIQTCNLISWEIA